MQNRLYVGNLSYSLTEEQLNELFSQAGKVASTYVVKDRQTGRSRGFGFVEFETEEDAKKAIEMFHEQEHDGRKLVVNVARPKRDDA